MIQRPWRQSHASARTFRAEACFKVVLHWSDGQMYTYHAVANSALVALDIVWSRTVNKARSLGIVRRDVVGYSSKPIAPYVHGWPRIQELSRTYRDPDKPLTIEW